jgi:hypothetical protein
MVNGRSIENYLLVRKSELKILNFFWIGFLVYTLSYTISITTHVNYVVCQLFQVIGLLIFIPSACTLMKFKIEDKYLQVLFFLYIAWLTITTQRDFLFEYDFIKVMLFDAYIGIFLYFAPLILLFPKNLFLYNKVFDVIVILGIFYFLYDVLFIKYLLNPDGTDTTSRTIVEYFSKTLAVPCYFLLLTYKYHSNKRKVLAALAIILIILFTLIRARRGLLIMSIISLLFTYLLYLNLSKQKVAIVLGSLFLGVFLIIFGIEFFRVNQDGLFNLITERGFEDTRSQVELCFIMDMNTLDWIIGKGINGQYFCPGIDPDGYNGYQTYRSVIETDYLQIILKGGLISLGLFLLIAIPAIFKGFFYSKNQLSKAAAIWILFSLINMYPSTVVTFTMHYLLVWISIGICYTKSIRKIPDEILQSYFLSNGKKTAPSYKNIKPAVY